MKIKNLSWRKSMELELDYNNMMAEFVGSAHGFTDNDIKNSKKVIENAYSFVKFHQTKPLLKALINTCVKIAERA